MFKFTLTMLSLALAMAATDILIPIDALKPFIQETGTAGKYMLATVITLKTVLTIALWIGIYNIAFRLRILREGWPGDI